MPPNYFCRSRWLNSVEDTGLEPVTSCVQDKRSPKTELIPQIKTPNAFYSRSSDIKSVSQNYRIPSIYIIM